ncbi:MAG TPA: caspase family protein [Kofleriaceae bacterium]|nr:caspase family protein [Kofleriaceae bacterium]
MTARGEIDAPVAATGGRNVIAVVAVDGYHHWPRLSNAVSDASGAAALFKRLGFEQITEPLFDERATGKAIQELVTDDLMALGPEDSLVLFYAGHGGTRKHRLGDQEIKAGYLIPVDAAVSPNKVATWIELEGWLRAVSLLPAKHILVILDACHSGIALAPILKWRDVGTWRGTPLSPLQARRSRRIITSALDDQVALDSGPVAGHSLFTGCLIEGLTRGIPRSDNRVTTGSELGLYLQRRVETYPGSRQTPDFGTFAFDDRGEMLIPLATELPDAPGDARSNARRERAQRILADAYDRWLEQGCDERRLLDLDTVIEILAEIECTALSARAIRFLDESAARNLGDRDQDVAAILGFLQETEALEAPSARFTRLLQHRSPQIRRSAVRLVRELDPRLASRVLCEHVLRERDPDILGHVVACLREAGVAPARERAEEILSGRPSWRTAAWALTGMPGAPAALLLDDGSDFARDLGQLLARGGFRVIKQPNQWLFLDEELDPAVLESFQMIAVVRGENFFWTDHNPSYAALAQYILRGGLLFATSWVAWETARRPLVFATSSTAWETAERSFAAVLPFHMQHSSHNEGISLRARPAQTQLARDLFPEEFTFEASFEELSPHAETTILLHGDNDIPLYGFRRVGQGECHYLNVCQHHCTRPMSSPLETAAFSRAIERVSRWLYRRCAERTSSASPTPTS